MGMMNHSMLKNAMEDISCVRMSSSKHVSLESMNYFLLTWLRCFVASKYLFLSFASVFIIVWYYCMSDYI